MSLKSLRLRRTNIFYPTTGDSRNLVGLLRNLTLDEDTLEDILELEEESYENSKQGVHAEELEALLKKAKKEMALTPDNIKRIYFHILRSGHVPSKISKSDYPYMLSAFERLLPDLRDSESFARANFDAYKALILFGQSAHHRLNEQSPPDYDLYNLYVKAWAQINKYSHMKGMVSKAEKFMHFAENDAVAQRFQDVLNITNYQHSRSSQPESYDVPTLYFWGMILTLLLNERFRYPMLDGFLSLKESMPKFEEHIKNLDLFISAVGDDILSDFYSEKSYFSLGK